MNGLDGVVVVAAVALAAPLLLALVPSLRLPAVVLELLAGIVLGPAVLGVLEVGPPLALLSTLGLAFLLLLAGLDVDLRSLRGRPAVAAGAELAGSLLLAGMLGIGLAAAGVVGDPVLVAVVLSSTALGIVAPVLHDVGQVTAPLGQRVLVGAALSDLVCVLLLSVLFSAEGGTASRVVLLGVFLLVVASALVGLRAAGHVGRIAHPLRDLRGGADQIRVRGAFLLLAAFTFLAQRLGLELLLGAFAAGVLLRLLEGGDADRGRLTAKLEAVGQGVFIPFFFVVTGATLDVAALAGEPAAAVLAPVFLLGLLAARAVPVLLRPRGLSRRQALAAGLLVATSLPVLVAGAEIGVQLGRLRPAVAAALVLAGLASVVLFPPLAARLLSAPPADTDG